MITQEMKDKGISCKGRGLNCCGCKSRFSCVDYTTPISAFANTKQMNVKKTRYIIILKNESAHERLLDYDGYLTNDIEDAVKWKRESDAKEVLTELDEPQDYEVIPLEISYKF
jgi:hypothetical protein